MSLLTVTQRDWEGLCSYSVVNNPDSKGMWGKSVVVINILVCSEHDNVTKNDPVWYKILHVLSLLISISSLDES